MKKAYCITYQETSPQRFCDRILKKLVKKGIVLPIDSWPVLDDNDRRVATFLLVNGPDKICNFLSRLSDYRGKDVHPVTVHTNVADGKIIRVFNEKK